MEKFTSEYCLVTFRTKCYLIPYINSSQCFRFDCINNIKELFLQLNVKITCKCISNMKCSLNYRTKNAITIFKLESYLMIQIR